MSSQDLEKRRITRLRAYAIDQAMTRFDTDYPDFRPRRSLRPSALTKKKATLATS